MDCQLHGFCWTQFCLYSRSLVKILFFPRITRWGQISHTTIILSIFLFFFFFFFYTANDVNTRFGFVAIITCERIRLSSVDFKRWKWFFEEKTVTRFRLISWVSMHSVMSVIHNLLRRKRNVFTDNHSRFSRPVVITKWHLLVAYVVTRKQKKTPCRILRI